MDSATPTDENVNSETAVTNLRLWFGAMGGAVAWTLHLLLAYAVAEFGCISPFREVRFLGFSGVAWLEVLLTLVMLVIAILASLVAKRNSKALTGHVKANDLESHDARVFMARSGVLTSRLFVFIIMVQSLPILFYLREC